jgi:hypothetical protein
MTVEKTPAGDEATANPMTEVDGLVDNDFEQLVFNVDAPELLPRFVDDASVLTPWAPPQLDMELQLDHLIGGGVLDVLSPPAVVSEIRVLNRQIRRLPETLRRSIESLRTSWHRARLFELVEKEMKMRGGTSSLRELELPGELFTHSYVPEIYRRAALRKLAMDTNFMRTLETEAATTKMEGHLVRLFSGGPRRLPELPQCTIPEHGVWKAESWLGLALSSMPEAIPEEVVTALAQRALLRYPAGRRRAARRRILHWGALHSTLAVAIEALAPDRSELEVYEVDTVGQTPPMPRVRWRSTALPVEGTFDQALIHLPPPGESANNLRNRYKNLALPKGNELQIEDIGRLGPRKWRRRTFKLLREVLARVKREGEVALVLPTSVRTVTRQGRHSEWGYSGRTELTDGVTELLAEQGWHVTRDLDVVEMNPQPQPFFVTRRCTWKLMLASRRQADVPFTDSPSVEDVFL